MADEAGDLGDSDIGASGTDKPRGIAHHAASDGSAPQACNSSHNMFLVEKGRSWIHRHL